MKGLALAVAVSLGLHGAGGALMLTYDAGRIEGAGAGGRSSVVSVPTAATLNALIDRWEQQPDLTSVLEAAPAAPEDTAPWTPPPALSKILLPETSARPSASEVAASAPAVLASLARPGVSGPTHQAQIAPMPEPVDPSIRTEEGLRPAELEAEPAPRVDEHAPRPPVPPRQSASPALVARGEGMVSGAGVNGAGSGETGREKSIWAGQIRTRIAEYHRVPRDVIRAGISGRALVRITVRPDGQLAEIRLVRSSGNARLDKAAISNIRRAGRMPKAPSGVSRPLTVDVPLNFELG